MLLKYPYFKVSPNSPLTCSASYVSWHVCIRNNMILGWSVSLINVKRSHQTGGFIFRCVVVVLFLSQQPLCQGKDAGWYLVPELQQATQESHTRVQGYRRAHGDAGHTWRETGSQGYSVSTAPPTDMNVQITNSFGVIRSSLISFFVFSCAVALNSSVWANQSEQTKRIPVMRVIFYSWCILAAAA